MHITTTYEDIPIPIVKSDVNPWNIATLLKEKPFEIMLGQKKGREWGIRTFSAQELIVMIIPPQIKMVNLIYFITISCIFHRFWQREDIIVIHYSWSSSNFLSTESSSSHYYVLRFLLKSLQFLASARLSYFLQTLYLSVSDNSIIQRFL